ncbi:hypothetical protein DPMN_161287 [Dreissena polymorpha]|uniref:Uncharacterized protein n=1 Tax=Dreissena polymorpha TaxID=45954 RepID=A0A9D4IQZ0_DREPO|nr:hypothetical protein DPMN_161287 [Dreissena polymorpha]
MLSRCRHDGTIPEVSEDELPQHFDIGKHAYVAKEPCTKLRDSEDKKMEVNAVHLNLFNPSKDSNVTEDSETQKIMPSVYIDDRIDVKKAQSEDPQVQKRITELERGEREGNSTRYIIIDQILYYLSDKDE